MAPCRKRGCRSFYIHSSRKKEKERGMEAIDLFGPEERELIRELHALSMDAYVLSLGLGFICFTTQQTSLCKLRRFLSRHWKVH